ALEPFYLTKLVPHWNLSRSLRLSCKYRRLQASTETHLTLAWS
ncbi:hypothetical protein VCHENC02_0271B, partial [Vibrio harveyi]